MTRLELVSDRHRTLAEHPIARTSPDSAKYKTHVNCNTFSERFHVTEDNGSVFAWMMIRHGMAFVRILGNRSSGLITVGTNQEEKREPSGQQTEH